MKKILILLTSILVCGCNSTETTPPQKIKVQKHEAAINDGIYSVEVEGHIYIVYDGAYCGNIIHAEHCPCKMK